MAIIRNIKRRVFPTHVWIIKDAPGALVNLRHLRNKYETNRDIKYWATWFLLKSLTTSGNIQNWIYQKEYLLEWLEMNEQTFRAQLHWLKKEELLQVDKLTHNLRLCSYEAAAEKLGITFEGVYRVDYKPGDRKQSFQYILRTEEIEENKELQLSTLINKIDKNPSFKNELLYMMVQHGADQNRLYMDRKYFANRLLKLQIKAFSEGSEIFSYISTYRADLNRGVKKIKQHHAYKSTQSVSYMKRKLFQMGVARIVKVITESEHRCRLYIPAEADTPKNKQHGGMRDGYKYVPGEKKTVWFLTDQVSRTYATNIDHVNLKNEKKTA